jgi:hypothetical protein
MGNLDGSPPDIEDRRPNQIPGVLSPLRLEKIEACKDAKEGWCHQKTAKVVPGISLAKFACNFIGEVTNDWSGDSIGDLTAQEAQTRNVLVQLDYLEQIEGQVDKPHGCAQIICKVTN